MDIEEKIRGLYTGWFFGPGAVLRKDLEHNFQKIQEDTKFSQVDSFEQIPTKYKLYDQMTHTKIVHNILVKEGKITPELFKHRLLELNKEDNILDNPQYGPSTKKAVRKLLDGKNPRKTGKKGVTTGGAMRCMPIGAYFRKNEQKLIENTYQSCIISHNTDVAASSAIATNLMISKLLKDKKPEKALEETLEKIEETYGDYGSHTAFAHMYTRIRDAVNWLKDKDLEKATETVAKKVGFSWYAIEAIPAAFAVYFTTDTPQETELISFKAGYNHTVPEIACAFHGAEKGSSIFQQEIMEKIESKNDLDIEKMVKEITEDSKEK